ncbi:MAG TPA: hypothetical protein VGC18_15575 [Lacisediminihabitans sp.]|uniref:hypothetical protein n=1 Tax=Lacisediminihabitans sp. TaxID=2787631 RepID=UPI002ED90826
MTNSAQRAAYWPVPIVRAIPAAGLALLITFSADHSARFGLLAFGGFGVLSGLAIAGMAWLRLRGSRVRSFMIAQGLITLVAGVLALCLNGGGVRVLFLLVTAFAAITGFLELYSGLRARHRFVASVDWLTVGGLTVVAAVVFLLIPPGYSQSYTGPDHVTRVLDAAVTVVGLLGVYGAISAVYLVIAGLSAKWGTQSARVVAPATSAESETRS